MEHLEHFGLAMDPFSNEPDLSFFYESAVHLDAQRRLERSAKQGKGLTILSGAHGSGKSLLTRRLFEELDEELYEAVLMVVLPGASDAPTILRRLARELGAQETSDDRTRVVSSIYQALVGIREEGRRLVLMVDDAQILGGEVMAELGGLLNMEHEGHRLLSMLWVGSSELEVCITEDPALSSRVDVHVRLQNLGLDGSKGYVDHRVQKASGSESLFLGAALDALFKASGGRPRGINTLADNALFEAYLRGAPEVSAADVERAALDLGLLPSFVKETPLNGDEGLEAFKNAPEPLPGSDIPLAIGKVNLIEGLPVEGLEADGAEAVLGLDDDDLWSTEEGSEPESAGPAAWLGEADAGQTLDLEEEWLPEIRGEGLQVELLSESSPLEEIELVMPESTPGQEGQPEARAASSIPALAEDAFLDLLED